MDFGRESGNQEAAHRLIFDYEQVGFAAPDLALCRYAEKLADSPGEMSVADVETLRTQGFSDAAISIATQVVGYFSYINRIADGLGVEPEPEMEPLVSESDWKARKRTAS
ncbi:MAG: hypothetical protein AAGF97_02035 [Planctomycetota bacterium]